MAGENKEESSDAFIGWVLIAIVVGAMFYILWLTYDDEIKSGVRWVRYAQMSVVSVFVDNDYIVRWGTSEASFQEIYDATPNIQSSSLDGHNLGIMSHVALQPLKWVFVFILSLMAFWTYTRGPKTQYIKKHTIESLIETQAKSFPVIQPFVAFNPSKIPPRAPGSPVPADLPLFAEALGPEEWVAYNSIPVPDGKVDQEVAEKKFAKQLGPRWRGAMRIEPYKQILLASFCLKASRKRDEADALLGRLSSCWSHDGGLKLSKDRNLVGDARKILRNKKLAKGTLDKCNQHAWETTALMRGLLNAREEGGVLAPAQFVWLRGHNRQLWYPLNNLGRNSYHMEAVGAMSHYRAEKLAQRPIPKAKVKDAVQSITDYMDSHDARPVPQLDYSGSKNVVLRK